MNELVEFLRPFMVDPSERRALVESALYGCGVLSKITWAGSAYTFTVTLVRTFLDYGECTPGRPAVVLLLEELRWQVGVNHQAQIDRFIDVYSPNSQRRGIGNMAIDPIGAAGMLFLIDVGRWAMSELKERWTLRRNNTSLELGNLTKHQLEAASPVMLSAMVGDLGQPDVSRILERVQKKRDLIQGWEDAKVADQRQAQLGGMNIDVLEARERDFNQKIARTLREIESDLGSLGFNVDKQPA